MNCPCHVQIFKQGLKSYRDLPLRMAEFGCVHRNELSGSMHGLMRVRQLTQDDGHIFCAEDQIQHETLHFIRSVLDAYRDFGFNEVIVKLATRPAKRIGTDELWDHAEFSLSEALRHAGITFEVKPGEAAFYGPKIEFHLKDCIGRTWQCGTLQLDYTMPTRLGAYYIAEDSSRQVPIMLHRAILGTFERFMGILIEHYAGAFPAWLAPEQVWVLPISEKHIEYSDKITEQLRVAGLRVLAKNESESIGKKIRAGEQQKIPYLLIIGDKEIEAATVAVRQRGKGDLGPMKTEKFIDKIDREIKERI